MMTEVNIEKYVIPILFFGLNIRQRAVQHYPVLT